MKEQILRSFTTNLGALTIEDIILNFFVAAILSLIIYLTYRITHGGPVYSARFNVSLVMLTLVTTLVMNVIGNNVALSLGMVGALSIVRFRTAIKDPRDTAFIFWGIGIGICCGVSEYVVATIGSIVIFVFLMLFGFIQPNTKLLLILRGQRSIDEEVKKTMARIFKDDVILRVENTTKDSAEYIYELSNTMRKKAEQGGLSITTELYKIEGVESVNIVTQNDEINR